MISPVVALVIILKLSKHSAYVIVEQTRTELNGNNLDCDSRTSIYQTCNTNKIGQMTTESNTDRQTWVHKKCVRF